MWRLDTDLEMSSKAFVIAHFARFSVHVFSHYFESHRKAMLLNIITLIIIRSKFFFLFIGQEPTTWPANNCLQIMVCSCAMPSNCVWLQIIFCSCVKETVLFAFLRSLLPENGRLLRFPRIFIKKQTRWLNDTRLSQNIVIWQCLADQLFVSAFGFGK